MRLKQWFALFVLIFYCSLSHAELKWFSATLDNDLFVDSDNGYTNGIFFSLYDTGKGAKQPDPSIMVKPLLWSLGSQPYYAAVNAYSVGQVMMTPEDITIKNPPEDSLPYSGVLFFNSTYLGVNERYADKLSTTVGMVGPISGAKRAQTYLHKIRGLEKPEGWSTQLHNEPVFQLSRGRAWRALKSRGDHVDLILNLDGAIGNLSSYVETGATLRIGNGLDHSYASVLLNTARTSNPIALNDSWYFYAGLTASYIFNQIYTDGNTFRNSRSVDYYHQRLGFNAGLAFAYKRLSVSMGFTDQDIFDNNSGDPINDLTQYGTVTVAWRFGD